MDGRSGIEVKNILESVVNIRHIVFVSSHMDSMQEAFGMKVIGFVGKPIQKVQVIRWIQYVLEEDQMLLELPTSSEKENSVINTEHLIYVEGNKDYINLHMSDRERPVLLREPMKNLEERLNQPSFVRIQKSYIVNMDYVNHLNKSEIELENGVVLPIGRAYKKNAEEKYNDYLMEKMRSRTC